MIYRLENKILVSGDGRLCSTCCPLGEEEFPPAPPFISPPRNPDDEGGGGYSETDCQYCEPDKTPNQITVRITGMKICLNCWTIYDTYDYKWRKTFNPNGLYLLEQTVQCGWFLMTPNLGTRYKDRYTKPNCASFDGIQHQIDVAASLDVFYTSPTELLMRMWCFNRDTWALCEQGYPWFTASNVSIDSDCVTIKPTPNDSQIEDCDWLLQFYGGTVEIRDGNQVP